MLQKAKKNFFSTYIGSDFSIPRAKEMLTLALEELSMPKITTDFGRSQDSGLSNPSNYSPLSSKTPPSPAPIAPAAQAQETLKQKTSQQALNLDPNTIDQNGFDALQDATPGSIKQGPDGSLVVKGSDGKFYYYNKSVPSTTSTPQQQPLVQNAHYDFLDSSLFEDSDIIAPLDTLNSTEPSIPTVKVEIEVITPDSDSEEEKKDDKETEDDEKKKEKTTKDKEDDEDSGDYDELASLPPLDLSNDIHRAVHDAQQDMMPQIRVLPTDMQRIEVMRDGPISTVKPINKPSKIKSIEEDPYGLSVVGMDNDIALRMM